VHAGLEGDGPASLDRSVGFVVVDHQNVVHKQETSVVGGCAEMVRALPVHVQGPVHFPLVVCRGSLGDEAAELPQVVEEQVVHVCLAHVVEKRRRVHIGQAVRRRIHAHQELRRHRQRRKVATSLALAEHRDQAVTRVRSLVRDALVGRAVVIEALYDDLVITSA